MSQPNWKLVANLGDVHPFDHGGYLVFVDSHGNLTKAGQLAQGSE